MLEQRRMTVKIRRDIGRDVKPGAEQIDGKTYWFRFGWLMDDEDPYPDEEAWWRADDPAYPVTAPLWIASGDLIDLKEVKMNKQEVTAILGQAIKDYGDSLTAFMEHTDDYKAFVMNFNSVECAKRCADTLFPQIEALGDSQEEFSGLSKEAISVLKELPRAPLDSIARGKWLQGWMDRFEIACRRARFVRPEDDLTEIKSALDLPDDTLEPLVGVIWRLQQRIEDLEEKDGTIRGDCED